MKNIFKLSALAVMALGMTFTAPVKADWACGPGYHIDSWTTPSGKTCVGCCSDTGNNVCCAYTCGNHL